MAGEALPYGRHESVFPHLQILAGKQDLKQSMQNIVINTPSGEIVLDRQIKILDGWVAGVDFLEASFEKGQCQQQPYPSKTSTIFTLS